MIIYLKYEVKDCYWQKNAEKLWCSKTYYHGITDDYSSADNTVFELVDDFVIYSGNVIGKAIHYSAYWCCVEKGHW